jgi:hypothetical protein
VDYMWMRCEGCKTEGNGLDREFKDKHRYCVANKTAQVPEPAPSIVFNGPKARSVLGV